MKLPLTHNDLLVFHLSILQEARKQLIDDFLGGESDEIYTPMFQYERRGQEQLRELSIERYFTGWVDKHWLVLEEMLVQQQCEPILQEQIRQSFISVFLQLLQKIGFSHQPIAYGDFMRNLLKEKIRAIEELFKFEGQMDRRIRKLQLDYEKDKAIYDRIMNKLQDEKNDETLEYV